MSNYKYVVRLFDDPYLLLGHSVSAAGARQVPRFPLTKRARRVCTAEDVEMLQAIPPSLRQFVV